MAANIELVPATREQEPIVANLLELYIHDFSEFHNLHIGADGRFGYIDLPLYWSEPERRPFLVRVDGKLAGLVFVKKGSGSNKAAWDMAEFFVLRGYRRRGIGTHLAHAVCSRFPGPWEVRVMQSNVPALHFWTRAISKFTGEVAKPVLLKKDHRDWYIFSFDSRGLLTQPSFGKQSPVNQSQT